jgi:hypothetical protein
MVRVSVWNRVSVSKTVALLRFVTLRPANSNMKSSEYAKIMDVDPISCGHPGKRKINRCW